ncbi:MAG: hypothetical protein BMS9Abin37_1147 [Acidobacteriota bacterium]|nr:MAG: hypothetical protein BMS9Abin37_1147 [Acidobacteriota bacterium]
MHRMLILAVLSSAPALQKADPALEAEVEARITIVERWASDPIVVRAVREANEKLRSMSEIELIDTRWQETRGVDDFIRSIIDHPAAKRLRELRASNPELQEAFLTDRLGANVAATNKTSDFYQGDEAKFADAYHNGAGSVHLGKIALVESFQAFSVQIGVPVMDEGRAIGILVVTVNAEKLKLMMDSK